MPCSSCAPLRRHISMVRTLSRREAGVSGNLTNAGTFRLKHKLLFIANALKQHHIGLDETADGIWSIYFGTVLLAKVDERDMILRD